MIDYYKKKMEEAHEKKQWEERNNYARAAKIDIIKYFYLKG